MSESEKIVSQAFIEAAGELLEISELIFNLLDPDIPGSLQSPLEVMRRRIAKAKEAGIK